MCVAYLYGVPTYKGLQSFRQVARSWQTRAVDQDGYHTNVAGEGCRDLDGNEVVWTIDSVDAALIFCFQPIRSDDGEKHVTFSNLPIEVSDKVNASRNVVDINEQASVAKDFGETIVKPTCRGNRVLASIVDENLTSHRVTAKSLRATTICRLAASIVHANPLAACSGSRLNT